MCRCWAKGFQRYYLRSYHILTVRWLYLKAKHAHHQFRQLILQFLRKNAKMRLPMAAVTHLISASAIVRNCRGWSASFWPVACVGFVIDLITVAKLLLDIPPVLSNPKYVHNLCYATHDIQSTLSSPWYQLVLSSLRYTTCVVQPMISTCVVHSMIHNLCYSVHDT